MNGLTLTATLNYCPDWTIFSALRELIANAKDTETDFSWGIENGDMIIKDAGEGLAIKHLFFGESHKKSTNAIGQFGEGLKIALIVLTRNGYKVEIFSGKRRIWNAIDEIEEGIKALRLEWEEIDEFPGTKIIIHDWKEQDDFSDKFVFSTDDERIVLTNDQGSILDQGWGLYSKGVFICDLPDYLFGYNVVVPMNRDRAAVSDSHIYAAVGKVWEMVESTYSWKKFFQGVTDEKCKEKFLQISYWRLSEKTKLAMQAGFFGAFGDNACIKTNDDMEREAKHRGAKVISIESFGWEFFNCLQRVIKTDLQYIEEKGGIKPKKATSLTVEQKRNLALAKKIAKKIPEFTGNVIAGNFPSALMNNPAHLNHETGDIWMDVSLLENSMTTGSIMIHELAHAAYGTSDMTPEMDRAICMIGYRLMG